MFFAVDGGEQFCYNSVTVSQSYQDNDMVTDFSKLEPYQSFRGREREWKGKGEKSVSGN